VLIALVVIFANPDQIYCQIFIIYDFVNNLLIFFVFTLSFFTLIHSILFYIQTHSYIYLYRIIIHSLIIISKNRSLFYYSFMHSANTENSLLSSALSRRLLSHSRFLPTTLSFSHYFSFSPFLKRLILSRKT
jgi:hypothetical protein